MRTALFAAVALTALSTVGFVSAPASALFMPNAKVSVLNCAKDKVRVCFYNNYDVVQKVTVSEGSVETCKAKSNCSSKAAVTGQCNTKSSCNVKIVKSSQTCFSGDAIMSTRASEHAYRIIYNGANYKLERANDSLSFFDTAKNRGCP